MKKYLALAGLVAAVVVSFVATRPSDVQATGVVPALVDTEGRLLHDGDVVGAANYGDPDLFIIKIVPCADGLGCPRLYKRLFLNPAIFTMYGHLGGFSRVRQITPIVRDAFETSGLFRNCETGAQAVWAVEVTGEDNGIFHHMEMSGSAAVSEDPAFFDKVFCINSREEIYYAKSIRAYFHLSEVPRYNRRMCLDRPACLDADNVYTPRCYVPEPAEGWCPRPTPPAPPGCYYQEVQCIRAPCNPVLVCPSPTPGPTISSVSVTTAAPGMRVTLSGSGFTGYATGPGGFTDQIVLSGSDGGIWTYPTETTANRLTFTVPNDIFPSPCTGDPDENCTSTRPLPAGHYFIRVVIKGDGLPRMVSNTADIDLRGCNPRPACLDANPACEISEPAGGWCPRPSPGPCYVGGCSNQLCTDNPNAVSTCEYRAQYVCYQYARCERQSGGACGWSSTDQFQQCWANTTSGY